MKGDGVFMLRRKSVIAIIIAMLISVTYIFAIDEYDAKPEQLKWLQEQISKTGIGYHEVGIEIEGIIYNEELSLQAVQCKIEEMSETLAHESDCSKLCQIAHSNREERQIQETKKGIEGSVEVRDEDWQYYFELRNQKDIHYNSYYDLKITGYENIEQLDMLRSRGNDRLKDFKVPSKESIYFKGFMERKLAEEERDNLAKELFLNLEAEATNYYEDDLSKTTCAYYGYTHHVKDYIKEDNGQKTNVQISFQYNEQNQCTQIIVAFPFYNEPF